MSSNYRWSYRGQSPMLAAGAAQMVGGALTNLWQGDAEEALARADAAVVESQSRADAAWELSQANMHIASLNVDRTTLAIQAQQQSRIARQQRARESGKIRSAAAASGVRITSGSVNAALAESAALQAQEEFDIYASAQTKQRALESEQRFTKTASEKRAKDILRGASAEASAILRGGEARKRVSRYKAAASVTDGIGTILGSAKYVRKD